MQGRNPGRNPGNNPERCPGRNPSPLAGGRQMRNGECRLMPNLAKDLAQTSGLWAQKLGPIVEELAQKLYQHSTALEQPRRWAQSRSSRSRTERTPLPTPLTEYRRRQARPRYATIGQPRPLNSANEGITWEEGPASESMFTREQFLHHVVPDLRLIPTHVLASATGLSEAYCDRIRAGRVNPAKLPP